MRSRKLPTRLRQRIQNFLDYMWATQKGIDEDRILKVRTQLAYGHTATTICSLCALLDTVSFLTIFSSPPPQGTIPSQRIFSCPTGASGDAAEAGDPFLRAARHQPSAAFPRLPSKRQRLHHLRASAEGVRSSGGVWLGWGWGVEWMGWGVDGVGGGWGGGWLGWGGVGSGWGGERLGWGVVGVGSGWGGEWLGLGLDGVGSGWGGVWLGCGVECEVKWCGVVWCGVMWCGFVLCGMGRVGVRMEWVGVRSGHRVGL